MSASLDQQLGGFASKHSSNGIFLDTNVMLLFIFAVFMPEKIEGSKRLAKYDRAAGELLLRYVQRFDHVIATPHILAETSNSRRHQVQGIS